MWHRGTIGGVITAMLVAACATKGVDELGRIAQRPAEFVGQSVSVCGYVRNAHEEHGIWQSSHAHSRGDKAVLGLVSAKATPHATTTCLTGEIVRTGCGEELICVDAANVPFALRVSE